MIQPSCIGEDGRPVPVSHILELAESIQGPRTEDAEDN